MQYAQVRLSFKVDVIANIDAQSAAAIFDKIAAIQSNDPSAEGANKGIVCAAEKTKDFTDDTAVLQVVVGEVLGHALNTIVPKAFPDVEVDKIEYAETPVKLPPPADAVPLLVAAGERHKP